MKKTKEPKGITLISLVITIILLLILATVAISLAVDSDGLFSKAGDAANKWNTSVAEEERIINELLNYDSPVDSYVTETSTIAGVEKERTAPIPKGYVASSVETEDKISEGLVIYETTNAVTSENHETAITEYNQYVWIPVDNINDMVMCQVCGAAAEDLDKETLHCPTCGESTKLAGRIYSNLSTLTATTDNAGNTIYATNIDFTRSNQTYSGFREPAVITSGGSGYDAHSDNFHGFGTANAFLEQLQSDFDNMAASVAKYGGFYISRYEVGENAESKKSQIVLTSAEDSANMWYGLNNILRKNGTSMTSQMIWGSQYDQVIKFIGKEAEIDHTDDRNITYEHAVSGDNPLDVMKNIYDLEGNHKEWTAAANSTSFRVGYSYCYSYSYGCYVTMASEADQAGPTLQNNYWSSRSALFVNL